MIGTPPPPPMSIPPPKWDDGGGRTPHNNRNLNSSIPFAAFSDCDFLSISN